MLTGWVDESGSRPDLDPGAYLLAAVLCNDNDVAELRRTMQDLRIGESKVHWHASSEDRRRHLVESVSGLPVTGFVVVHIDGHADDRRHRRKCMEFLLPHLAHMGCSTITFESRSKLDAGAPFATCHRVNDANRACGGTSRTSLMGCGYRVWSRGSVAYRKRGLP